MKTISERLAEESSTENVPPKKEQSWIRTLFGTREKKSNPQNKDPEVFSRVDMGAARASGQFVPGLPTSDTQFRGHVPKPTVSEELAETAAQTIKEVSNVPKTAEWATKRLKEMLSPSLAGLTPTARMVQTVSAATSKAPTYKLTPAEIMVEGSEAKAIAEQREKNYPPPETVPEALAETAGAAAVYIPAMLASRAVGANAAPALAAQYPKLFNALVMAGGLSPTVATSATPGRAAVSNAMMAAVPAASAAVVPGRGMLSYAARAIMNTLGLSAGQVSGLVQGKTGSKDFAVEMASLLPIIAMGSLPAPDIAPNKSGRNYMVVPPGAKEVGPLMKLKGSLEALRNAYEERMGYPKLREKATTEVPEYEIPKYDSLVEDFAKYDPADISKVLAHPESRYSFLDFSGEMSVKDIMKRADMEMNALYGELKDNPKLSPADRARLELNVRMIREAKDVLSNVEKKQVRPQVVDEIKAMFDETEIDALKGLRKEDAEFLDNSYPGWRETVDTYKEWKRTSKKNKGLAFLTQDQAQKIRDQLDQIIIGPRGAKTLTLGQARAHAESSRYRVKGVVPELTVRSQKLGLSGEPEGFAEPKTFPEWDMEPQKMIRGRANRGFVDPETDQIVLWNEETRKSTGDEIKARKPQNMPKDKGYQFEIEHMKPAGENQPAEVVISFNKKSKVNPEAVALAVRKAINKPTENFQMEPMKVIIKDSKGKIIDILGEDIEKVREGTTGAEYGAMTMTENFRDKAFSDIMAKQSRAAESSREAAIAKMKELDENWEGKIPEDLKSTFYELVYPEVYADPQKARQAASLTPGSRLAVAGNLDSTLLEELGPGHFRYKGKPKVAEILPESGKMKPSMFKGEREVITETLPNGYQAKLSKIRNTENWRDQKTGRAYKYENNKLVPADNSASPEQSFVDRLVGEPDYLLRARGWDEAAADLNKINKSIEGAKETREAWVKQEIGPLLNVIKKGKSGQVFARFLDNEIPVEQAAKEIFGGKSVPADTIQALDRAKRTFHAIAQEMAGKSMEKGQMQAAPNEPMAWSRNLDYVHKGTRGYETMRDGDLAVPVHGAGMKGEIESRAYAALRKMDPRAVDALVESGALEGVDPRISAYYKDHPVAGLQSMMRAGLLREARKAGTGLVEKHIETMRQVRDMTAYDILKEGKDAALGQMTRDKWTRAFDKSLQSIGEKLGNLPKMKIKFNVPDDLAKAVGLNEVEYNRLKKFTKSSKDLVDQVKSVGYWSLIGLNLKTAIRNRTQNWPLMAVQMPGSGLSKASNFIRSTLQAHKELFSKEKWMEYREKGLIQDRDSIFDADIPGSGTAGKLFQLSMSALKWSEFLNKVEGYKIGNKTAKDFLALDSEAERVGIEASQMTNYLYGREHKPAWANSTAGNAAYFLSSFPLKFIQYSRELWNQSDGFKTFSEAWKKKGPGEAMKTLGQLRDTDRGLALRWAAAYATTFAIGTQLPTVGKFLVESMSPKLPSAPLVKATLQFAYGLQDKVDDKIYSAMAALGQQNYDDAQKYLQEAQGQMGQIFRIINVIPNPIRRALKDDKKR